MSTVPPTASYEAVASERLHARSLAALMAAYPSTSASTAAFDQYSEYSDDCSADSESFSHGATPFGGAMKNFKNPLSKSAGALDLGSSGSPQLSKLSNLSMFHQLSKLSMVHQLSKLSMFSHACWAL